MNREGTIEQLSLSIKRLILHQDLVMIACNIFREFASDRENKLSLSNISTISAIIDVMHRYTTKSNLQFMIFKILQSISSNDDTRHLIVVTGGTKAIVEIMGNHILDEVLQEEGCKLLRLLSVIEEDRFKNVRLRKLDPPFHSKDLLPARLKMTKKVSDTKLKLPSNDRTVRQKISDDRGIEAILDTIEAHHKYAGIQGEACGALANLAIDTMAMEKIIRDLLIVTIIVVKQTLMRIMIR